ncbi:MAG: hypothetical protein ACRDRH_18935 [Pseudonocardia sp.]
MELICDDAIAVARTTGMFSSRYNPQSQHVDVPDGRWVITILRTASLDAA